MTLGQSLLHTWQSDMPFLIQLHKEEWTTKLFCFCTKGCSEKKSCFFRANFSLSVFSFALRFISPEIRSLAHSKYYSRDDEGEVIDPLDSSASDLGSPSEEKKCCLASRDEGEKETKEIPGPD